VNAVHAELRKLLTLPSLRWTALLTLAVNVLLCLAYAAAGSRGGPTGADALAPLASSQAGFLAMGALAAASEHQAGAQIRTTLLALPRRLPLQAAKATALVVGTLPVAAGVAATVALVVGDSGRTAAATAYLVLTTVLAASVGGLVRRLLPALLALLTLYFVAGPLLRLRFGSSAPWLPDTAATDPSHGAAATVVWTLAALVLAAFAVSRRDA